MKNWLIRTKTKQILGPITKQKVIEFVENGSLTSDDEITSGNGYWIWIREKELLSKYLLGDIPQTFNPISEAVDVLTGVTSGNGTASISRTPERKAADNNLKLKKENLEEDLLPEDSDLEYPDMGNLEASESMLPSEDDLAMPDVEAPVSTAPVLKTEIAPRVNVAKKEDLETTGPFDGKLPEESDLEFPDAQINSSNEQVDTNEISSAKILPEENREYEEEVPDKQTSKTIKKVKTRNDRYLLYLMILVVFIIGGVLFYFKQVLNKPFPVVSIFSSLIVSSASAQSLPLVKKKA